MQSNTAKCPLCDDGILNYSPIGDSQDATHLYACTVCPFVGFEYYNQGNIDDIHRHITKTF